jgi:hypothetical protein
MIVLRLRTDIGRSQDSADMREETVEITQQML